MSELIQMRQRIKAIQTIKKVTHAMRLIAMSTHTKLKEKKGILDEYTSHITKLLSKIHSSLGLDNPVLWPPETAQGACVIIIGSQKGLSGVFQISLESFITKHILTKHYTHVIVVGKNMLDFAHKTFPTIHQIYDDLKIQTIPVITNKITDFIWYASPFFRSVTIVYNYPKTFFAQQPQTFNLIPFENTLSSAEQLREEYHWEESSEKIFTAIAYRYLSSTIRNQLFSSLIAEQAARFVAMDSSTRNAETVLETMNIEYNKIRQAKITRELTDLIASF